MKRVTEEIKQKSNLKPLYNSSVEISTDVAYYDPTDTHVHIFKTDFLQTEQNHMEQTYRYSEDKSTYCTYCIICHKIKHDIILSKSAVRSIHSLDLIKNNNNLSKEKEYTYYDVPLINYKISREIEKSIEKKEDRDNKEDKDKDKDKLRSKLFINNEGILNNYVKIV